MIAFITGATAGIGRATAKILAGNGFDVIITGRREELLQKTEKEIRSTTDADVLTLCFDVRSNEEVVHHIASLKGKWEKIDVLVNNAGLASGLSPIHEGDLGDWEKMIDTNIKGLLFVTRAITPQMTERKSGHIINIGSIAAKEVYENDIAEAVLFAVSRPPHVNINDLVIMPTAQANTSKTVKQL